MLRNDKCLSSCLRLGGAALGWEVLNVLGLDEEFRGWDVGEVFEAGRTLLGLGGAVLGWFP